MKKKTFTQNFQFKKAGNGGAMAWLTMAWLLIAGAAFSAPGVSITLFSAHMPGDPNTIRFDTDHNANRDLSAGYVVFQICNTSGSDLTNGDLTATITVNTGTVPANNTGIWELENGQPATQDIYSPTLGKGNLENGECVRVFWFVGYPTVTTQNAVNATTTISVSVADGTGSASIAKAASTQDVQNTNAAGLVLNTVIDPGPNAYVGQLIEYCVEYKLGNIPGQQQGGSDVYFQPAANSDFDAGSYQLVGSKVVDVQGKIVNGGITPNDPSSVDKIFFNNVIESTNSGNDNLVEICYTYRVISTGAAPSSSFPYANHISGAPWKYNGDYGGAAPASIIFPAPQCPDITVEKVASPDFLSETALMSANGADRQVTYTVTITNNTVATDPNNQIVPVDISLDAIEDVLQIVNNEQLTFIGYGTGSDINQSNSSVFPFLNSMYEELRWEPKKMGGFYSQYFIPGNGGQLDLIYILEFKQDALPSLRNNTVTAFVDACEYSAMETVNLPIQLAYFRGRAVNDQIRLEWRTDNEIDNDYMAVERSADGRSFAEIGRVTGRGNTYFEPQTYALVDPQPLPGVNYYRLRQVDFDGTTEYHPVIAVQYAGAAAGAQLSVFPNPTSDRLNVRWTTPDAGPVSLQLFDFTGRQLARYTADPQSAGFELPVNYLPAGLYLLQVGTTSGTETVRFEKR